MGAGRRPASAQPPRIPSPSSLIPFARASAKFSSHSRISSLPVSSAHRRGHGGKGVVGGQRRGVRLVGPPLHGGVDRRRQTDGLGPDLGLVALLERGEHLAAEELERFADVLVAVPAGLQHEDDLVDARLLEPLEVLAHLPGRPRGPPEAGSVARRQLGAEPLLLQGGLDLRRVALLAAAVEVLAPDVGRAGADAPRRRSSGRASSRRSCPPRGRGRAPPAPRGGTSSASRTRCWGSPPGRPGRSARRASARSPTPTSPLLPGR